MSLLTIFNYHLSCITQIKNPETSIIVSGMFYVLLSMTELKIRSHQAFSTTAQDPNIENFIQKFYRHYRLGFEAGTTNSIRVLFHFL